MIQLGALFPDHLNLNGDLGNLLVLQKQFEWRGLQAHITPVTTAEGLRRDYDLLFIGHGSDAAWEDIHRIMPELTQILKSLIEADRPIMAVSTGFEKAVATGVFSNLPVEPRADRVSKFEVLEDGGSQVLGYLNTDSDLPGIYRSGNFLGTMLHGPVLSRNPEMLRLLLTSLAGAAGMALPEPTDANKADHVAGLIAEVWKLEEQLASE